MQTYDFRDVTCGLVPRMGDILASAESDEVVFLVRPKVLPQISLALSVRDWDMAVEHEGDELNPARLRFERAPESPEDRLNLI